MEEAIAGIAVIRPDGEWWALWQAKVTLPVEFTKTVAECTSGVRAQFLDRLKNGLLKLPEANEARQWSSRLHQAREEMGAAGGRSNEAREKLAANVGDSRKALAACEAEIEACSATGNWQRIEGMIEPQSTAAIRAFQAAAKARLPGLLEKLRTELNKECTDAMRAIGAGDEGPVQTHLAVVATDQAVAGQLHALGGQALAAALAAVRAGEGKVHAPAA